MARSQFRSSEEHTYNTIQTNKKYPFSIEDSIKKAKYKGFFGFGIEKAISFITLFSLISVPVSAEASFFGFFSASETQASEVDLDNSQNMDILDPSFTVDTGTEGDPVPTEGGALIPEIGPLGTPLDIEDFPSTGDITIYTVRDGDSISEIAKMFDVSVNTILWANDMPKGSALKKGQVLTILPVTGIKHTVKKGDTLKKIATLYKGDLEDIASYNGFSTNESLAVGSVVIIPDGEMTPPVKSTTSSSSTKSSKTKERTFGTNYPAYNGTLIRPIKGGIRTQGLHARNGVDIGAKTGTPIYAASSGKVIIADGSGYNGGFGLYVVVDHGGGVQTLYAHMSRVAATVGDTVSQGELIGYVGNTGRSTGPHLHFEVHGAKNPIGDNPRYGL